MAKYRVGVIGRTGHGNYGHDLDLVWKEVPETEVVAVADDDRTGLAKAAERLGGVPAFADYRKMLDETKPDVVAIAPRWIDRHEEMAVDAAERGIHVFMEKPFVRTLEEADRVIDAGERTHAKLALAHPTRYSPLVAVIRELIAAGEIGTVLEYRGRGKEDARGGGEDLWVLGSHVFDMLLALAGASASCFACVTANGKPATKADVREGNEGLGLIAGDAVSAAYAMPDGSTFHFASRKSAGGTPSRYGLQILGSRGVIELVEGTLPAVHILRDPSWSPGRSGKAWERVTSAGIGEPEPLGDDPVYKHRLVPAVRDLLEAIEANRQPHCSAYVGRTIVEMTAAIYESHRLGRPVTLPLETRVNPLTLLG